MMLRRSLVAVVFVLAAFAPARAADQTVRGIKLVLKNPTTPDKRKITLTAKETASDDTLVGDPVVSGAMVTISANGGSPSRETYDLPAGTSPTSHKPYWFGTAATGFKYGDPKGENGPVKTAQLKLRSGVFQIRVVVDGRLGAVGVVPPNPGTDGCALLTINGGDSYSVQFGGGTQTSTANVLFKVVRPTGEGSCVTTTTTTTTTTSSTTTTTLGFPYVTPPGPAPLRYRDPVFAAVNTTTDVDFGSAVNLLGQTVTLRFDLYQPAGDAITLRPMIIWVHGGSFSSGNKNSAELVDEANTFAKKGYVNASITYRLEPPGCSAGGITTNCVLAVQEAMQDAQTAVRFFRTNAVTYGIDTSRITIAGTSAGAITALNLGFDSTEDPTAAVAAAVSLSGANLLGPIDANDPPTLLFHGTADTVVPYAWAVNTVNQARALGLDSFLTSWTGAGHVPYVQHRTEILDQTTNFLYWELDMGNAAQ